MPVRGPENRSDDDCTALLDSCSIRNYKSIAHCRVDLHPLTFLVGPNGPGKSNFLDALWFTSESLRDRGGSGEVRRRRDGHPTHFGIRLEFRLTTGRGHCAFQDARPRGGYEVQTEECVLRDASGVPAFRPVCDALSNMVPQSEPGKNTRPFGAGL